MSRSRKHTRQQMRMEARKREIENLCKTRLRLECRGTPIRFKSSKSHLSQAQRLLRRPLAGPPPRASFTSQALLFALFFSSSLYPSSLGLSPSCILSLPRALALPLSSRTSPRLLVLFVPRLRLPIEPPSSSRLASSLAPSRTPPVYLRASGDTRGLTQVMHGPLYIFNPLFGPFFPTRCISRSGGSGAASRCERAGARDLFSYSPPYAQERANAAYLLSSLPLFPVPSLFSTF